MSLLVSGYSSLPKGLSTYYWALVSRLAWFYTVTHLTSLTFLRKHLYRHPRVLFVRLVFMLAVAGLLFVAIFSSRVSNIELGLPAECFFQKRRSPEPTTLVSSIVLLYAIFIQALQIFEATSNGLTRRARAVAAAIVGFLYRNANKALHGRCWSQTSRYLLQMLATQPIIGCLLSRRLTSTFIFR